MEPDFTLESVSHHAVVSYSRGNCGGVALNDFIVAIDSTLSPNNGILLREKLENQFDLPVKYLIITHSHADHVFGAKAFKDTTIVGSSTLRSVMIENITSIWSPEALDEWKKANPTLIPLVQEVEIVVPSLVFENKLEILDGDLRLEIYSAGGHTADSSFVYFPYEKILFAGDLLFAKTFPYASDPTCNPEVWILQLERFLTFDVQKFVPGHGPVIDTTEVEKHLAFLRKYEITLEKLLL